MKDNEYQPPKIWTENNASGGVWSKINRPTAGARYEADLPVGKHPLQLYSMGTPNGQKVTILLEELLALGEKGAEYDAHLIRISEGEQFSSGFVSINPNSKIPALMDYSSTPPVRVLSLVPFCFIWPINSVISYRNLMQQELKRSIGCSGYKVQPLI